MDEDALLLLSNDNDKAISCTLCDEVFSCRSDWLRHVYKHRVWVPDETRGGPFPENLYEEITSNDSQVLKINMEIPEGMNELLQQNNDQVQETDHNNSVSVNGSSKRRVILAINSAKDKADAVSVLQNIAEKIPKPVGKDDSVERLPSVFSDTSSALETLSHEQSSIFQSGGSTQQRVKRDEKWQDESGQEELGQSKTEN